MLEADRSFGAIRRLDLRQALQCLVSGFEPMAPWRIRLISGSANRSEFACFVLLVRGHSTEEHRLVITLRRVD